MYEYAAERGRLFTEEGQVMFLNFRDTAKAMIAHAGAARLTEIMMRAKGGGESWMWLACADRMIELGELREITGPNVAGQHRVFVAP